MVQTYSNAIIVKYEDLVDDGGEEFFKNLTRNFKIDCSAAFQKIDAYSKYGVATNKTFSEEEYSWNDDDKSYVTGKLNVDLERRLSYLK